MILVVAEKSWVLQFLTKEQIDVLEQCKTFAFWNHSNNVFLVFQENELPNQYTRRLIAIQLTLNEHHVWVSISPLIMIDGRTTILSLVLFSIYRHGSVIVVIKLSMTKIDDRNCLVPLLKSADVHMSHTFLYNLT